MNDDNDDGRDEFLFVVLALHGVIAFLHATYPFLTWTLPNRDRWDTVYVAFVAFIYVHGVFFRNECILAFLEKRLIDPSYEMGACPFVSPFRYRIEAVFGMRMGVHTSWLALISTCIVLGRMRTPAASLRLLLVVILVITYVVTSHVMRTTPPERCVRLHRRSRCVAQATK